MDLKAWNRIVPWELCDLRHFCYFILSMLSNTECYIEISDGHADSQPSR